MLGCGDNSVVGLVCGILLVDVQDIFQCNGHLWVECLALMVSLCLTGAKCALLAIDSNWSVC